MKLNIKLLALLLSLSFIPVSFADNNKLKPIDCSLVSRALINLPKNPYNKPIILLDQIEIMVINNKITIKRVCYEVDKS